MTALPVLPMPDFCGHTIFCDDVRVENTGKQILLGVYPGHMLIHGSFPFVLPKLCLLVHYYQLPGKFHFPVKFVVFLPGDPEEKPSIEIEVPEESGSIDRVIKAAPKDLRPDDQMLAAQGNFAFANLSIASPGPIRVRAVRPEGLVRLGSLLLTAAPQPQQSPAG